MHILEQFTHFFSTLFSSHHDNATDRAFTLVSSYFSTEHHEKVKEKLHILLQPHDANLVSTKQAIAKCVALNELKALATGNNKEKFSCGFLKGDDVPHSVTVKTPFSYNDDLFHFSIGDFICDSFVLDADIDRYDVMQQRLTNDAEYLDMDRLFTSNEEKVSKQLSHVKLELKGDGEFYLSGITDFNQRRMCSGEFIKQWQDEFTNNPEVLQGFVEYRMKEFDYYANCIGTYTDHFNEFKKELDDTYYLVSTLINERKALSQIDNMWSN